MQAGIELGISAEDAMRMTAYSMEGATELILNHDTHPLLEIEKAATPGGATIKGLNELEHLSLIHICLYCRGLES